MWGVGGGGRGEGGGLLNKVHTGRLRPLVVYRYVPLQRVWVLSGG